MLIRINNTTVINIEIYNKNICSDDLSTSMCELCYVNDFHDHLIAAQKIINIFGDDWTPLFFKELKKEINKKLIEHDKQHNTNFSKEI